jgi:hypothetical protein
MLRDNKKNLSVSFNHRFRYIDGVLSVNNYNFHNYVHLIYPDDLKIKHTTEFENSATYLDILFNIDSKANRQLLYMTKMMILNFQSSTFLFYVVTYYFYLVLICISPS